MTVRDSSYSWPARSVGKGIQVDPHGNFGPWGPNYDQSKVVTRVATRDGVNLPSWRQKIADQENATTSLSGTYDTISYSFGYAYIKCAYKLDTTSTREQYISGALAVKNGQHDRNIIAFQLTSAYADNQARAKFYKALRQTAVQMSGPTFLGELRETLHMLRRPAKGIWDSAGGYLGKLKKLKKVDPRNWARSAGELWLEQSFGWAPLLNDCQDAAKAWNRLMNDTRSKMISKSFMQYNDRAKDVPNLTFDYLARPYAGTSILVRCRNPRMTEDVNVRYKGKVTAKASGDQWRDFALFGFTPSEFIPTAWELLPWSFLVDYFTNIGDLLTASVTDTSNVVYVNKTVRQASEYSGSLYADKAECTAAIGFSANCLSFSSNLGGFKLRRKTINRTANSGISLPRFQFDFDLGSGQLGNIAALLTQAGSLHPQRSWHR